VNREIFSSKKNAEKRGNVKPLLNNRVVSLHSANSLSLFFVSDYEGKQEVPAVEQQ
jgi:hypothetical protein